MQKTIKGLRIIDPVAVPPSGGGGGKKILVFKTNLTDQQRIHEVKPSLDIHPHIMQWNVDLHDCDKVLRVVSKNIEAREIEQLVLNAGYYCEELQ